MRMVPHRGSAPPTATGHFDQRDSHADQSKHHENYARETIDLCERMSLRIMHASTQKMAQGTPRLKDWPTSQYDAVTVDPPWDYGPGRRQIGCRNRKDGSANSHYATLDRHDIAALPVGDLLKPGAHLWLWIPNLGIAESWHTRVLDAWGVRPVTLLTWVKQGAPALGRYARGTTEHVILAVNGWGGVPDQALPATHFGGVKSVHSVKPGGFADLVEQLKPGGAWCELFGRQQRLGWDTWGHGWEMAP